MDEYLWIFREDEETRAVGGANLGYWHPSTTGMITSGVTDSHPLSTIC